MGISKELYEAVVAVVDDRLREIRVTREDFDELRRAVVSLAEAQRRTEARLEQLAEAQARSEARLGRLEDAVARLAEAQQRTEEALQRLAGDVGQLSDRVGYGLEDIARIMLPGYLERHLGLRVGELERRFCGPPGREVEVNLYGEGEQDGRRVTVLGEAKRRIHAREVKRFERVIRPVVGTLAAPPVKVMVGHVIHPSASRLAAERGILVVAAYQR